MKKMLIADDNIQITAILEKYAIKEGFEVVVVHDGEMAVKVAAETQFDIILLDVMMPRKDGFQVCREIRQFSVVPIIMITARGEDFERIMGFEIGADDYIVKPFYSPEVMARVRAVLRRVDNDIASPDNDIVTIDNLTINLTNHIVKLADQPIPLTKKEFDLLWTLATNKSQVFSRDRLLNLLWGYDYYGDNRTVDTHIKRLRHKLAVVLHPKWDIKTIRGVGYRFEETMAE